jgi:hypothetical protein
MTGHVARIWVKKNASRTLVGKPEGNSPLGRPRRRRKNIEVDLRETGRGVMNWIDLSQYRDQWRALVNTVGNVQVPQNSGKLLIG